MYVFLDSNVCFTDPFMKKNIFNRILLELSEATHITLCMSEVVRKEVLNNFEKELTKHYESIKKSEDKVKKFLRETDTPPLEWLRPIEYYIENLDAHLTELEENGYLEIIEYSNDILPELVERSIKRIKPFSENKNEFRDAIIWFSYVQFAKNRQLEQCYFLTNNTEDFARNGEIHPDLQQDSTAFILYKNSQDFIQKSEEVKELQKVLDLERLVEEQDFPNNPDVILNKLEYDYFNHVYEACSNYVINNSDRIPTDVETFETHWLELYGIHLKQVENIEVETILENIVLTGYLVVEAAFEVYERNPMYEPGEEEYLHMGSDEADLNIKFSLTLDENLEIEDLDIDEIEVE